MELNGGSIQLRLVHMARSAGRAAP